MNSRGLYERSARRHTPLPLHAVRKGRLVAARASHLAVCGLIVCAICAGPAAAKSESDASKPAAAKPSAAGAKPAKGGAEAAKPAAPEAHFDIDEYRVEGADNLPQIEVEAAVYPFLGPNKSAQDVEKARAAVEKAYHDKGLQTVSVAVPQQDAQRGFVVLKVTENRIGRLRVKGSRYFDLDNIKSSAPSLKEGSLPNFQSVTKDIVALNRWPDRRITPALRAGVAPGTVDVDLNVEDTYPLHGSIELNNKQSPSTTPLRNIISMRYDDLWQLGHSMTWTYQFAPMNPKDAMVVSGSYLARTEIDWLSVMVYGLSSDSSVATVGGSNVVGPGQVVGGRAVLTLPSKGELFHTLSLGVDYKDFKQTLRLGSDAFDSPVTYVPLVGTYGATWQGEGRLTQLNATITAGLRGIGSSRDEFDAKRFDATASFITLHADISHTQDFAGGFQLYARLQGQAADQPLVSSEQFSLGGQDTVRGYLESEVLGDYGVAGTLELRTPNLAQYLEQKLPNPLGDPIKYNAFDDWRFFAFADAGNARIHEPLPDQQSHFDLASYGVGMRMKSLRYLNSIVFVGMPLTSQQVTVANHPRFGFRVWGEF
ncbi:ShlB/FhaC/HecB family hemolysin secretion/activation protein [Bradyrhizobium centrolobii]|uniref:ShlB/FhaC/HecB family hemolysin secretion/activation protein n=1 Tax=Bradyrhizobium centrolobii TaxID=1505087 RepID=UPI000AE24745|nr:ShlB/FhaC/HecB family hemolysin secretion/activation protein [Bradyrhizobium centrolobii]